MQANPGPLGPKEMEERDAQGSPSIHIAFNERCGAAKSG